MKTRGTPAVALIFPGEKGTGENLFGFRKFTFGQGPVGKFGVAHFDMNPHRKPNRKGVTEVRFVNEPGSVPSDRAITPKKINIRDTV